MLVAKLMSMRVAIRSHFSHRDLYVTVVKPLFNVNTEPNLTADTNLNSEPVFIAKTLSYSSINPTTESKFIAYTNV